ncbi:MAG: DNA recombination protein RmuC [Actinomycetes bacterium]
MALPASLAVLLALVLLAAGFAAGVAVGLLAGRSDQGTQAASLLDLADARFREAGARTAADVDARRAAIERTVAPLEETLGRVEQRLLELERARVGAYSGLVEQVRTMAETSDRLRQETASLAGAMRAPQGRGRWGELQLRRVVELAGMVEHCDFSEQLSVVSDGKRRRPDLVVHLGQERHLVVDAKVPLAAYLAAVDAPEDERAQLLREHARALRSHVDDLASRGYDRALGSAPEIVVLFVPGEAFLAPALEADPALLEHAMAKGVLLASPTSLVAMLRAVAFGWQQQQLAESAREIVDLGRELYIRLGRFGAHVDRLGRSLQRTVAEFNGTVGSLERHLLPQARRFAATRLDADTIPVPGEVDEPPRGLTAVELLDPGYPRAAEG